MIVPPEGTDTHASVPFEPFEPGHDVPDVLSDRLCAEAVAPHAAADTTFLDCRVDGGRYAPDGVTADGPVSVVVWNMERGLRLDDQLAAFAAGEVPMPDILLASELDRGCSRTGGRDVSREIGQALGLDYVFGVEFLELPRQDGPGGRIDALCEHGNAVFSRFPLGNVASAFHAANDDWYTPPEAFDGDGEPRLGGRSYVLADADLGDGRLLRLISVHYESRIAALDIQVAQAEETAALADTSPMPVLVGGDTNSPGYSVDVFDGDAAAGRADDRTLRALLAVGLLDAHAPLPPEGRATRAGLTIDLLLGRDVLFGDPWVCPGEVCDALSDHRALGATVAW